MAADPSVLPNITLPTIDVDEYHSLEPPYNGGSLCKGKRCSGLTNSTLAGEHDDDGGHLPLSVALVNDWPEHVDVFRCSEQTCEVWRGRDDDIRVDMKWTFTCVVWGRLRQPGDRL
jgi:hypothetical protein